ncbi:MAG: hypothetical protein AAGD92_15215 [Pseudomonadota bacterium]
MNKTRTNKLLPELRKGRVHEISGPAAASFAFLMTRPGEAMVCGPPRWLSALHPESVGRFFDPNSILLTPCPLDTDVLWAAENALRAGCIKTVFIVTDKSPGLTNFRRLQLAALAGKSLGLMIVNRPAHSTAAETRWHCAPSYAGQPGEIRIHASLYKNKRGNIGSWIINVFGEEDTLYLDAAPAGEPVWPNRIAG